jgi:hypothetical protein
LALSAADDGCPSATAFVAALRAIVPDVELAPTGLRVELSDDGADYRVVAGALTRDFTDPAVRCDERARKAAVLVALALAPPTVAAPPARAVPAGRRTHIALEVGGVFDAAPRPGSNSVYSGGAQVRLYVGAAHFGGVVSVAGLSPTTLDVPPARARLRRVPLALSLRGQLRRGRLGLSLDLGAVVAVQITDGVDVAPSVEQTRLELGIRLEAKLEYWAWRRIAPFLAIQGEYDPVPYNLVLPSAGIVGTTPPGWVGAVAGLAFALR